MSERPSSRGDSSASRGPRQDARQGTAALSSGLSKVTPGSPARPRLSRQSTTSATAGSALLSLKHGEDADTQGFFGSIQFDANQSFAPAKWISIGKTAEAKKIVDMLLKTWKLPPPCSLLSFPGEPEDSVKEPIEHEHVFVRGIAEVIDKAKAWVFTSGIHQDPAAALAGRSMQYMQRELSNTQQPCIAIISWSKVPALLRKRLGQTKNGMVYRVQGKMSKDQLGLDFYHTHFVFVDGAVSCARVVRDNLERYISSNDLSKDAIRTPKVVLQVAGGPSSFRYVSDALNPHDYSSGGAVPVLVLPDTGGVAADIHAYCTNEHRPIPAPPEDTPDDPYCKEAAKWLPRIQYYGAMKGNNTTEQLGFFSLKLGDAIDDEDTSMDLPLAIQTAMLNDCPNMQEEALLAIKWNETVMLQRMLAERRHLTAPNLIQDKFNRNPETISLLQVALTNGDVETLRTLLNFIAVPVAVVMDELFSKKFNRYPIKATKNMWYDPRKHTDFLTRMPSSKKAMQAADARAAISVQRLVRGMLVRKLLRSAKVAAAPPTAAASPERAAPADDGDEEAVADTSSEEVRSAAEKNARGRRTRVEAPVGAHASRVRLAEQEMLEDELAAIRLQAAARGMYIRRRVNLKAEDREESVARLRAAEESKSVEKVIEFEPESKPGPVTSKSKLNGGSLSSKDLHASSEKKSVFYGWQCATQVLSELVDGYRAHIDVRQSLHLADLADKPSEQMVPTWTDLMMWAVLSGQDEMAVMLWAKSKEPLRAALMASQLCRRLHHEPELRADAAHLLEQSEDYEQLALDVLDAIRDSEDAAQILSLIPWQWYDTAASIRNPKWARKYLWTDSPIEMCEEDGKLSYPCRRVVAHRHSQYLCDKYLHGEYPGSSCRISHSSSMMGIFLQMCFFFFPGAFVEMSGCSIPHNKARVDKDVQTAGDAEAKGKHDIELLAAAQEFTRSTSSVLVRNKGSFEDLMGAVEEGAEEAGRFFRRTWGHVRTGRFLLFFLVPKVKFVSHMLSQLLFMLYTAYVFVHVVDFQYSKDDFGSDDPQEIVWWVWALARALGEFAEIPEMSREGLRLYLRDPWNKLDLIQIVLSAVGVIMRVVGRMDLLSGTARNLFGLVCLIVFMRVFSFLRYYQSVSVLIIVIFAMIPDILVFLLILMPVTLGAGFFFAIVLLDESSQYPGLAIPGHDQAGGEGYARLLGSSPVWAPFWGMFGEYGKEHADMSSVGEHGENEEFPSSVMVNVVLWVYLFVSQVVLLNLLIAMMADSYAKVTSDGEVQALYDREGLIRELKDSKPPLAAPLNLLHICCYAVPVRLYRICTGSSELVAPHDGFKRIPAWQDLRSLQRIEKEAHKKAVGTSLKRVQSTVDAQLERQSEATQHLLQMLRRLQEKLLIGIDTRLDKIEQRLQIGGELAPMARRGSMSGMVKSSS